MTPSSVFQTHETRQPRELATDIRGLADDLKGETAQDYVDGVLAAGWDVTFDGPDSDDAVRLLDDDDCALFVDRDELPKAIDVEVLPVTPD